MDLRGFSKIALSRKVIYIVSGLVISTLFNLKMMLSKFGISISSFCFSGATVDGSELRRSPVNMVNLPLFTRFYTCWVVGLGISEPSTACLKIQGWNPGLLFDGMLCESLLPEIVGFSTAISACEKRSQWQQAWLLFEAGKF